MVVGVCMVAGGACMVVGGVRGCRGVCMVAGGVCMASRGCVWLQGGAWLQRGHAWLWGSVRRIRRDTVNERAVCILLECILVFEMHSVTSEKSYFLVMKTRDLK